MNKVITSLAASLAVPFAVPLAVALAALSTSAVATTHKEAPNMAASAPMPASGASGAGMGKQQNKMGACSDEFKATGRPGAERQAFMATCLKKGGDMKIAQQTRMKTCSSDFTATKKPGAERQAFMKECLSK